jgi:DNA polymerase (family 10)
VAHGLNATRLLAEIDEIDRLNTKLSGITLLKGIEVDILEDGRLGLPDNILAQLDLVIGAVHSRLHLPRQKQTERILRAMDRPYFHILAHPTGRLIQEREPYDVDMPRIIRQARHLSSRVGDDVAHTPELLTYLWEYLVPHAQGEEATLYRRAIALKVGEQQEVSIAGGGVKDSWVHKPTAARSQAWKRSGPQPAWPSWASGKTRGLIGTRSIKSLCPAAGAIHGLVRVRTLASAPGPRPLPAASFDD